ncbi:MAG: [Kiritimatiellae bacterium]|nr:[FeFe] hydrogenase H-cluster maturation GTPase HydF [Kiritimatiellia bacterium]
PCGAAALEAEKRVAAECSRMGIPLVTVRTKKDLAASFASTEGEHAVSARTGEGVAELLHRLAQTVPAERQKPLLDGLVRPGDVVLCIAPIDEAAPKGRLILPQQQAIREIIEGGATAAVCQPDGIGVFLAKMPAGAVKFAITDSQAFAAVDRALPKEIPLTSFSILFARAKGDLAVFDKGLEAVKTLRDGDTVLVAEGCTHLRQCGDIGSVKIPAWLGKFTSKKLRFVFASGGDFDLGRGEKPALVVHCGGCMLTRRSVMARLERCRAAGVPVVNYGLLIAYMHGIHADPATCMVAGRGTGDKDR